VDVRRLPRVHPQALPRQQIEVVRRVVHRVTWSEVAEPVAPPVRTAQLVHQRVARRGEVARHLEGQPGARSQRLRPGGQQFAVLGYPLQDGVADEHVDAVFVGERVAYVADGEGEPLTRVSPRLVDHRRGGVEAEHFSVRPAPGQFGGQCAGTAARVHDIPRVVRVDSGDQVVEGTGAFGGVAGVELGVPYIS